MYYVVVVDDEHYMKILKILAPFTNRKAAENYRTDLLQGMDHLKAEKYIILKRIYL
jgi:hypothetical protein